MFQGLSGTILGVTMMALQGPALRIQDQTEELYNTERKPTPDGLAALPGDYSQIQPEVSACAEVSYHRACGPAGLSKRGASVPVGNGIENFEDSIF